MVLDHIQEFTFVSLDVVYVTSEANKTEMADTPTSHILDHDNKLPGIVKIRPGDFNHYFSAPFHS